MTLDATIGGASADTYGTLSEYETYIVANVDASFSQDSAVSELNLRRAAQYLDRQFRFVGTQQYQTQARAWPRLTEKYVEGWPINPDTVPMGIKHAQFEAAYAFQIDSVDPFATLTAGTVSRTRSKAGPVETETEYEMGRTVPRLVAIEGLLREYVTSGFCGTVKLGRA